MNESLYSWNTLLSRYFFMFSLMDEMIAFLSPVSRYTSGNIRRRVLGSSPISSDRLSQYSGCDVYWSQATTAHFFALILSEGRRISGALKPKSEKLLLILSFSKKIRFL